ncbi:MAG: hypothetical protein HOW97_08010 [Catenulispora sp.]|nr:hypothetical protein [Catenulispora sp.]
MTAVDVAAAEAAVAETAGRLADDLPFEERYQVARQHEANLMALANARQAAGAATYADRRRIETDRLRFAAEVCGDFGIEAYSLASLPQQHRGGAR